MLNLVTGGTGHIGNVLIKELLHRNERVRALILPNEDLIPIADLDVEIVYGNVCDYASLIPAMTDVDYVYHLAGIVSIMPGSDPVVQRVNVEGTANIVKAAHDCSVKKFVYTSSIHAFKRMPHGITIDEGIPIDPKENLAAYDHSKAEATLAVIAETKKGFPAVIVCPTGVIGPYDYKKSELGTLVDGWSSKSLNFLIDGEYDFVDVRDVVLGMIRAREKGRIGQIYILSGHLIRVIDLWRLVKELVHFPTYQINIPLHFARFIARFAERYFTLTHTKPSLTSYSIETLQTNAVISNAKACSELGYSTRSLRETLQDTVQWWHEARSSDIDKRHQQD